MKKRILLITVLVAILACIFAISVNAAEPSYKDGEWIYAADGTTKLAIRDTDGNPLIWYMNGSELKYVRADQTDDTQSVYVKYSISAGGNGFDAAHTPTACLKDIDIYDNGTQIEGALIGSQIVLLNIEHLEVDAFNGWLFGNKNGCCTIMRGIVFPSTLKYIGQEGFTNHKIIQMWNLENTQLEWYNTFSQEPFSNRYLTQEATNYTIKFPDTLTKNPSVAYTKVKNVIFSPNSTDANSNQTLRECSNLETVYIHTGFVETSFNGEGFRSTNNFVMFFTGTEEQALALKENSANSYGHNNHFKGDKTQIISYATYLSDKDTYDNAKNLIYIVYGYNYCEAFYDGTHDNSVTYGFAGGEAYTGDYCKYEGCDRCGEKSATVIGKLLVNKGYSVAESGDGFTYDITFDKDVIAIYEQNEGITFKYGIVAGKISEDDGGKIVTASGEKANDNVFTSLFDKTSYELLNVKVTGVNTAEYKAKDVYLSAFIIDGEDVYYLGQGVTSEAVAISYDKIFALNTPSSDEE